MEKKTKKQSETPRKRIKIVVYGPESAGKTTLAKQLAAHYDATYIPEFARIYAEKKLEKGETLTVQDVIPIAEGQAALEAEASDEKLVICDTDLLQTLTYAKLYYPEFEEKSLEKYLKKEPADFYFLTYIDVSWEADGIRDLPYKREETFFIFEQTLQTNHQPYELLTGNAATRFQKAKIIIDKLLVAY